jgi:hypothetical protein
MLRSAPPAAVAAGAAFVRGLVDPALRAHVARIGARDYPVVGTAAEETVGSLLDRVARASAAENADKVLVVALHGSERRGLLMWLVEPAPGWTPASGLLRTVPRTAGDGAGSPLGHPARPPDRLRHEAARPVGRLHP